MAAETMSRWWERGLGDEELEVALMSIGMMVMEEEENDQRVEEKELDQSR
jgi:hypothetical protein